MSFYKYLVKAKRNQSDKVLSTLGGAAVGVTKYTNRILGMSASKMRGRMDNLGEVLNKTKEALPGTRPVLEKIHSDYTKSTEALTRKSNATRIKTGLTLGAAGLTHSVLNNSQNQTNPDPYTYNY